MDGSLRIRGATPEDVPTIVRHRRRMFEEMGFADPVCNDEMDAEVSRQLRETIPSGAYRGWLVVADRGEAVAGAGLGVVRLPGKPFNPSGAYGYLMSLYVEPPYRRRGIARRLMETMVAWARAEGLREVKLHASASGRPLYERLGFEQTNEMRLLLR